jgi:hypothetical protein
MTVGIQDKKKSRSCEKSKDPGSKCELGHPAGQSTAILAYRKRAARTLFVHESFRVVAFPLAFGLSAREFQETCSHIHCIRIR